MAPAWDILAPDWILADGERTGTAFTAERIRAHFKHDRNGGSMERKEWDDPAWLAVLLEEVGEVARAICEHRHLLNDPATLKDELEKELIQVGAMTAAWIGSMYRTGDHRLA